MAGQPPLEASIEIAVPPAGVWAVLSDLRSMSRRSPELVGTWMFGAPRVGRWALHLNRRRAVVWPTLSRLTRWKDPAHDGGRGALAFYVWPTDVEWSYELEPSGTGTLVTERRTALPRPSLLIRVVAKYAMGGADSHDVELLDGMHRTLAALAADTQR
ncbi:SRPBCC family protein [Aeromicrobium fastidiosum]|uniref:SRPBCC family protein n=1 Tax=Aeromicrobium fastidiosum TaxID=52699 RepID=A0A641AQ30_9ACTN|nr:SRPBCC family protein [Aeromicrobium fastidiosum]KAA1378355.1 SRPBCC family protein [Aeromicrobium fastidiosum]MBP2392697.1 hypothetical protein [Aeromicrobium fastidiosum]